MWFSQIIYGKVKTMNISDEEVRRFAEDGAIVLRKVFRGEIVFFLRN